MTTQMKDATSSAVDKAGDVVGQTKERTGEAAGSAMQTARTRARDEIDRRSSQAGDRALGTAGDMRAVSEELRRQGKEAPAKVADQAAQQIEKAGTYLRDADSDRLLQDVERFGRERPWAIAAAGVAIGMVAARALKASSAKRYRTLEGGKGPEGVTRPAGSGVADPARPAGLGGR
jgi:hypothetical protein